METVTNAPRRADNAPECEDCAFGCCCAEHGYTSHVGADVPALHYPFPVGYEEANIPWKQ